MKKLVGALTVVLALAVFSSPQLAYGSGAAKIGRWFKVANFTIRVNSWKCGIKTVGDPNNGGTFTAQKSFCLASLTVVNSSKVPAEFDNSATVTDVRGRKFNENDSAAVYANEKIDNFYNPTINPTFALTGNIVFDVPKADKFINLQIQEVTQPVWNIVSANVTV
ncbi:MAG: DUF4352 domain-containing protein [Acidobacteria bacterium]|nr:DUF4352 domain-containing protein [Acidobacteriota bacterium]